MTFSSNSAGIPKRFHAAAAAFTANALFASAAAGDVRIIRGELVAVLAVSSGEFCGASCGTASVPNSNATLKINAMGDGLQVLGINTAPNSAEVVKLQSFRDFSAKQLKSKAVCEFWNRMATFADAEPSVSFAVEFASPKPASRVRLWCHLFQQAVEDWSSGFSHACNLASSMVVV